MYLYIDIIPFSPTEFKKIFSKMQKNLRQSRRLFYVLTRLSSQTGFTMKINITTKLLDKAVYW